MQDLERLVHVGSPWAVHFWDVRVPEMDSFFTQKAVAQAFWSQISAHLADAAPLAHRLF